jgi:hypothetical protein
VVGVYLQLQVATGGLDLGFPEVLFADSGIHFNFTFDCSRSVFENTYR